MLTRTIQHLWAYGPQYPFTGSGVVVSRRRFAHGCNVAAVAAFNRTHPPVRYRTR